MYVRALRFRLFFQVIAAEGEQKASRALKEASDVIADTPAALQLRYLQVCRLRPSFVSAAVAFFSNRYVRRHTHEKTYLLGK
jgi:hypothetical protein